MFVTIQSAAVFGVDGYVVHVEVNIINGLPAFDIVGLPDTSVRESKDRVRAAIMNSGLAFPQKRITVNLAPADVKKSGPGYDLPMALGLLASMGQVAHEPLRDFFFAAELSLDGALRPITGVLSMALAAKAQGAAGFFVSPENAEEAALVGGLDVFAAKTLQEVVYHFAEAPLSPVRKSNVLQENFTLDLSEDLADVAGQAHLKRAVEVAAAGCHNLLMIGPPGAGKTMLARRMPTILPDLTIDESMEITKIYSIAGKLPKKNALITTRPFRAPHHTASYAALTGGGRIPEPGEISLAHNGVLFLDELPEFSKKSLETLRQPLEDGQITISRVGGICTFPSMFLLLAAMNPCPCGYYGSARCVCQPRDVNKYVEKISGPMLDRIDIQVEAAPVDFADISKAGQEASAVVKKRVEAARLIQLERFEGEKTRFNAKMTAREVKKHCVLCKESRQLIKTVFDTLGVSGRSYHKILKIARTLADLARSDNILPEHVAEAIFYRGLDRKQQT